MGRRIYTHDIGKRFQMIIITDSDADTTSYEVIDTVTGKMILATDNLLEARSYMIARYQIEQEIA